MFYSHQLLARKAPLGQIWMAATTHAKINRRKLDKLNLINICEEILNPTVPMALRLSGILMGGVVIVYDRKVKLLYEDVTRFLVEINNAWKVKIVRDPTLLPKSKSHAKLEDVTLLDNQPTDLGETEQPLQFSNSETPREFPRYVYSEMNLDTIDEAYISQGNGDFPQNHHQANIDDITMRDKPDSYQTEAAPFNLFERFDIDGDDETQVNSPFHDHTDIPSTLVPSPPPPQPEPEPHVQKSDEQHPGELPNQQVSDEDKAQYNNAPQRQKPTRRVTKRLKPTLMDHGETIIPGHMYQSWLQDPSDLVSRRGQKRKVMRKTQSMKIARLMDLPPVAIACGLVGERDIYYPRPLLKLWKKSTQPLHDSPSGNNNSPPHPHPNPPAPSPSPPEGNNYHDDHHHHPISPAFDHGEVGSGSLGVSIENARVNIMDNKAPSVSIPIEKSTPNHTNTGVNRGTVTLTPSNSAGDDVRSMPSTEFAPHGSDVNSGRSNKKRLFSSSTRSGSNLEPVVEELLGDFPDPPFKLPQLSENENDLVVQTSGPTQTQKDPIPDDQPKEQLTDSIRKQLKTHFDTPGISQRASLDQLAFGLNRKAAAGLFYQTCVLATRSIIKVEQKEAYGDVIISRGPEM